MMRVTYLVNRLALRKATFVLRELDALDRSGEFELEVVAALGGATDAPRPGHRRWEGPATGPPPLRRSLMDLGWWLLRRPWRLVSSVVLMLCAHWRATPIADRRSVIACALRAATYARVWRDAPRRVHAHFYLPMLTAWFAHRFAGTEYSFTLHTEEAFVHPRGMRAISTAASRIATVSERNRRLLAERTGRTHGVTVVRAWITPDEYAFRAERELSAPALVVTVAVLERYKGHRHLVDAARILGDEGHPVRLVFAGDGPLKKDIEARAAERGVTVEMLGSLTEREVGDLLARADAFVLPSVPDPEGRYDGIPVALMEAMAAGVPVVSTRTAAIGELVIDGETGWMARPGDADDLARALDQALHDPERAAVVRRARRHVEQEFSCVGNQPRLVELLGAPLETGR